MRIEADVKLDFNDVLIRPKRSELKSRKDVILTRKFKFKHADIEWLGIPIMASNMDGVGTLEMALELQKEQLFTALIKTYEVADFLPYIDLLDPHYFAVSTGTSDSDFKRLCAIIKAYPKIQFICIDVANGYSEHFGSYVAKIRKEFPKRVLIAGNVVTGDMAQELVLRGADIIKIGIGPGSVCTTRLQTGVGYPQLSAVIECADAVHGMGAHIISDGGCTTPGDVAKAMGAGADFVMLGGMLAGHEEGHGEIVEEHILTKKIDSATNKQIVEVKKLVQFYGMSSTTAMKKKFNEVFEYRTAEGGTVYVPYRGKVEETIKDILGGLRSTCTYVGAPTLKQLSRCTTFVIVHRTHNDVFLKR
jgi:GMP reductase